MINDPAARATNKRRSAAFEWLREASLSENPYAEHAAVAMYEIARLIAIAQLAQPTFERKTNMSTLNSKLDSIKQLSLEPIPGDKALKAVKVARIDSIIVALGEDGTIYSNSVQSHLSYAVPHGCEGMRLGRVLDACIKLGVLSAKAVKEHKADAKARRDREERRYAASTVLSSVAKAGVKLTAKQIATLEQAAK